MSEPHFFEDVLMILDGTNVPHEQSTLTDSDLFGAPLWVKPRNVDQELADLIVRSLKCECMQCNNLPSRLQLSRRRRR